MREFLFIIGLVVLAVALRSCRHFCLRKLGAFLLIIATFFAFYLPSKSPLIGALGASGWFFLPWVELLTRIRRLRLPLENRLRCSTPPADSSFPDATDAIHAMEDQGFDHVSDSAWEWAGMKQYFRIFWHPEQKAIAIVCLCEQQEVSFAFISITSKDEDGRIWRSTNFPFSPTLKCNPEINWNHVPCEQSCFNQILSDHTDFLIKRRIAHEDLCVPDPDEAEEDIENEMRRQIDHNLAHGIIQLTGDGNFRYSKKGLFFLWKQFIKDMIRLC